jgi:TonB family protein
MIARSLLVGCVACLVVTPGLPSGARLGAQVAATVADSTPATTAAAGMVIGADVEIALRTGERGTPAPIHAMLVRAKSVRRGAPGTGTFPARLRVEHAPARAFAAAATPIVERKAGPAQGEAPLVATLTGTDGTLTLLRLPDAGKKQPAYQLLLTTPSDTTTAVPDEAEARVLVHFFGDLGERLDPDGKPDLARIYERATQVDWPAMSAPGGCAPKYPERLRRADVEGQVRAQFVVTSIGRVDPTTFKAVRSTHRKFEGAVRDALPCLRYRPAELRGQPVRMRVQQPFTFRMGAP